LSLLILVVDDEPDVEALFRQQFRRELRAGRFAMEFAQSAPTAVQRITDAGDKSLILILSDINMPGMSGLELAVGGPSPLINRAQCGFIDVPLCLDSGEVPHRSENGAMCQQRKSRHAWLPRLGRTFSDASPATRPREKRLLS